MTDTPIDRESVERLADFLQDEDLHEEAQRHVADTLLALRAALDEAEARAERAAQEARAMALQEAAKKFDPRRVAIFLADTTQTARETGEKLNTATMIYIHDKILAMLDNPAAEARADALWSEVGRAAQEARAVALEEAADLVWKRSGPTLCKEVKALMHTPAAEALERVRAEERERLCALMEGLAGEFGFVDVPMADSVNQSVGIPRVGDQFAARMRTFVAAIRAQGETKKAPGD